jgi:DNA-binding NtrC family response regulator
MLETDIRPIKTNRNTPNQWHRDCAYDVPATLREAVARFEKTLISQAISNHGGRMDAVAEALGIGRRTLNDKIVKLGLEKSKLLE